MDKLKFLEILNFPDVWATHDLLPDQYFAMAISEFEQKYGGADPKGGDEHWRFGAFIYLLKMELNSRQISLLIDAAIADPDQPMAGGVLAELLSNDLATKDDLDKACQAVMGKKYYYITPQQLVQSFNSGVGPYGIKP